MSNGSSGRPSRLSISRPRSATAGAVEDGDQELLHLPLGDLALPLEAAGEEGRLGRAVGVDRPHRVENAEQGGVAGVRLAGGEILARFLRRAFQPGDRVGLRVPEQVRIVDHRRRDLLADDAFHHLQDQPLAGEPVRIRIRIVGRQLIAQSPVADQPQALAERALPRRPLRGRHEPVQPQVVAGDVLLGGGVGAGNLLLHRRRHPQDEAVHQAGAGPGLAIPARPFGEPLRQGVDGEVEQGQKGHPGAEEVLVHVGGEVEIGQQAVRRAERAARYRRRWARSAPGAPRGGGRRSAPEPPPGGRR